MSAGAKEKADGLPSILGADTSCPCCWIDSVCIAGESGEHESKPRPACSSCCQKKQTIRVKGVGTPGRWSWSRWLGRLLQGGGVWERPKGSGQVRQVPGGYSWRVGNLGAGEPGVECGRGGQKAVWSCNSFGACRGPQMGFAQTGELIWDGAGLWADCRGNK